MLATLKRWLLARVTAYEARGVTFTLVQGGVNTPDPSFYVDVDTARFIGRICCWSSGQCDLEILDVRTGERILYAYLIVSDRSVFDSALDSFFERML
jgi:hypothetical protein